MIDTNRLTLVNYCHRNCVPLRNIVRLPRAEAFALAEKMARENEGAAFFRFGDFENYYALRMAQDAALRKAFIKKGGCPVEAHPLSFVLEGSAYLKAWFGGGVETRVLLSDIPDGAVSFTRGDSGATYDRTGALAVITKEEMIASVKAYDGDIEGYMRAVTEQCHYIEAQLWDDRFATRQASSPCAF